ncbi:neuroglian-like [Mytilus trossulus]|uniref:neuroglian-like n=1 Tax=Mytilus trossulus TaxID=6551 RepID=UPI0030043D89
MMCVIVLAIYSFLQLPTNSGSNLENAEDDQRRNSSLREETSPQTCNKNIHEEPPLITSRFEESYYMKEEDDLTKTFQCRSSGNPTPTFEWIHDGRVLSNYYSLHISLNQNTGKLTITKPSLRDFGTYQCFATNKYGTAASAAFQIERAVITSFSNSIERTLPDAYQYRSVSIPCVGKRRCQPNDECRVEWKLGDGTSNTIRETKRIAIDKNGTLHFLYVDLEDTSTAATPYACGINNELMRAFYKGGNVIMTILRDINPNYIKPKLLFSYDVKGLLGRDAELQCIFSGYPLPDIEWYSPGINQLIQPSSKYQFTDPSVRRNLKITHLELTDEGTYRCKGVNIGGYVEARIYVNVTSKPIFQEGEALKSQVIPDGQNAVFRCKMESLPAENTPSEPIWRINRKELSDEQYDSNFSHKYQLSADKEILTIKNVKYPEDSSSISCETGNIISDRNGEDSYAKSYAYAFLRVMACPSGFIFTNGSNCEPCTKNWYGNDCLCFCECNDRQR